MANSETLLVVARAWGGGIAHVLSLRVTLVLLRCFCIGLSAHPVCPIAWTVVWGLGLGLAGSEIPKPVPRYDEVVNRRAGPIHLYVTLRGERCFACCSTTLSRCPRWSGEKADKRMSADASACSVATNFVPTKMDAHGGQKHSKGPA